LVEITMKHHNIDILDKSAIFLATLLRQSVREKIMGPEYPLISRIQRLYLKCILVKIENGKNLSGVKVQLLTGISEMTGKAEYRSVQCTIDVDPY
jgi:primosomal protein N' (replication factor Y)